jgi:hypothetical protein
MVEWFGAFTTNQILTIGFPGQTKACATGEYDMLDWMTMDPDLRNNWSMTGTHVLATTVQSDKFWWVKHASGNIWDSWLYDDNRIYWYLTEMDAAGFAELGMAEPDWGSPVHARYFKRAANFNFPAANRCQKPGATFNISDSRYVIHGDCQERSVKQLGNVQYSLAGPETDPALAGDLAKDWPNMKFLRLIQDYQCGTQRCQEEWQLSQRYGLTKWRFFKEGIPQGTSAFNSYAQGARRPNFPCD